MSNCCDDGGSAKSRPTKCPRGEKADIRLPYDELCHEVNNNFLAVRVGKKVGRIKPVRGILDGKGWPQVTAQCEDGLGNKCRPGCARVNVVPNKAPPPKEPEEEMFRMHASRQMLFGGEEMRNILELELRTPRNYIPLPKLPPNPGPIEVKPPDKKGKKKRS